MIRCLVVRSSIVWIEYHSIISSLPSLATKDEYKEASFTDWLTEITSKNRPDEWVSHPPPHPQLSVETRRHQSMILILGFCIPSIGV